MSKVRRKPPPPFPYSPRYPHPDPLDPFAPLKVLRERASSNNAFQFRLDESSPTQGQFLPSLSSEVLGAGLDITYPPSSSDHHGPLTPLRPWLDSPTYLTPPRPFQEPSGGYHSDTTATRPTRPLRPRVKAGRESKAYFSEAELPPVPPVERHRDEEYRYTENEQPADSQHQYRRRSQSVFIPRPLSQGQGQDENEPPLADVPPSNASAEALTTPHTEPKSETDTVHDLVGQYMYDDRQSHGYVFDQFASDSDAQDSPTVDAHVPEQSQSQPSATPPMTPDDTLSLSSSSARGRSTSPSPRSLMPDLPRDTSQPALRPKTPHMDEHAIVVQQEETPLTAPIHSADFPLLRTPSRPPSPGPNPPALPVESHEETVETDSEPETSTLRRRTLSASKLLRRSSSTA
ncbi:hypothetical protein DAEQUDRAFT_505687 [Daedalea quercina L-15889]|uniref:Uncharacterized protein n=1 Tax=Daedalea quercina L-15889 TaxID=1314783 RepID=A0A165T8D5_9APHY|nr:hypothetical protein DAEQUDRAFT_505687 [Daedalea quercina L-15889]